MVDDELHLIKTELLWLIGQQTKALENLTFIAQTGEELRRYDERRERIYDLGQRLSRLARNKADAVKRAS